MKTKAFRLLAALFVAVLSVGFTACGGDDDAEKTNNIVGVWQERNPNDKSFISLAHDGSFKMFVSRNDKVGFILDAGYYSQDGNSVNLQSVTGQNYNYTFTSNSDGSLSIPIEYGKTYTFQKTGMENNAHTNPLIGKTFKCSEGGYMWVGGTDYGTIEFVNGYMLKYIVTTVKSSITQKVESTNYKYLFFNNKLYIQQDLGFYICTYTIKNNIITITDADGRQVFR